MGLCYASRPVRITNVVLPLLALYNHISQCIPHAQDLKNEQSRIFAAEGQPERLSRSRSGLGSQNTSRKRNRKEVSYVRHEWQRHCSDSGETFG